MMSDRRRSFDHDGRHEDRRNPGSHGSKKDLRRSSYNYDRRHDTKRSGSYRDSSRFEDDQSPSTATDKRRLSSTTPCSLQSLFVLCSAYSTARLMQTNQTVFQDPSLPSTKTATMHQAGLANSPPHYEPDMRSLIDIFCDKVWWLMQCEQERKKEKKLLADRERCPPGNPETLHYSDILRLQIEQCQKAKKKCSDRMNMADDKLVAGIVHLMEKYAPRSQIPPAPGDSDVQKEDIDATLESFRGTLHASVNQRIEEEVEKLRASTQSRLRRETEELKKSLESERQRNDRLEKRLEDMEQKFKSLSQRQDMLSRETAFDQATKDMAEASTKLKQVFARLDRVSVNSVTKGDLSTALEKFDDAVATPLNSATTDASSTPGGKTALRLQQLSSALDDIKFGLGHDAGSAAPPCILHLQNQVSSGAELIQDQSEKSEIMSETIKTLRGSISSLQLAKHSAQVPLPSPAPATATVTATATAPPQTTSHMISQEDLDIKIARMSTSLVEDIKGKLATVVKELGSFIDNERREREKSSVQAHESCAQVESLRQGVDELRTYTHTSIHRLDKMDRHHVMQLQLHRDAMASFDSRLQLLAMEHAGSAEEVALQLRVLNKWQSNFTTKPMYREIVDHITKTLPTGTIRQLSALSLRLDAVESQLGTSSDGTLKKRKTQG